MRFTKLQVENFRNIKKEELEPDPYLNIIYGDNAQGKSNFLEAVYFLCFLRSYRTKLNKELAAFGQNFFKLEGNLESPEKNYHIKVLFNNGHKKVICNKKNIEKLTQYYGNIAAVMFSPDDIYITKGKPENRRRYIDLQLAQIYPKYINILIDFKKILYQRNTLLKQIKKGYQGKKQLYIWDGQYSEYSYKIIKKRKEHLEEIKPLFVKYHEKLTEGRETAQLDYKNQLVNENEFSIERMVKHLEEIRDKEIKRGISLLGPHRDDIEINVNGCSLREYGSQGQQRTAVLSLKLAELEILKEKTRISPLLLLDDVLSELDYTRRKTLLENINCETQLFITTTENTLSGDLNRKGLEVQITEGKLLKGGK